MRKKISLIIIGLLLLSCNNKSEQIDSIWKKIVHSKSGQEEQMNVAELHQFIREKQILFELFYR